MHLKYISCEHLSHILAVLLDADSQNTTIQTVWGR